MRRNGGMLQSLKVGLSEGSSENLNCSYAYNSFGDLSALTEDTTSYAFTHDGLGRLTAAYGRTYSYDGANRLTAFNGQQLGYGDAGPYHAVDRIGNADRFDYDANGNMTKRSKGLSDQQTLVWNAENRLSEVQDNNGDMVESYWYDIGGARVKKTSGATTTYTFFGHYEEEVTNGVTTAISHYSFGSLRIAVKRGSALYHLHGDHLGSTSLTTLSSTSVASRAYYAYGAERSASGDLKTDRTFTGQKSDATGLLYYNARYYDPNLGTFISPDTLVPNAGMVIDYNRFAYARNNPLRYRDESGHTPWDVVDFIFWGWSLKDFIAEPTWAAAGWLALDTVSLLPLIPSAGYFTRAGRFFVNLTTDAYKQSDRVVDLVNRVKKSAPALRKLTEISEESLATIERYGIDTYSNLQSTARTIQNSEYHHLVEKRFYDQLGFQSIDEARAKILSIELPKGSHRTDLDSITTRLRNEIGYNKANVAPGEVLTNNARPQQVWSAHRKVYTDLGYEDWAELIWEVYFQHIPGITK